MTAERLFDDALRDILSAAKKAVDFVADMTPEDLADDEYHVPHCCIVILREKRNASMRYVAPILDALRECLRDRRATVDELLHFARICRVERVMRPYLEAMVAIGLSR